MRCVAAIRGGHRRSSVSGDEADGAQDRVGVWALCDCRRACERDLRVAVERLDKADVG